MEVGQQKRPLPLFTGTRAIHSCGTTRIHPSETDALSLRTHDAHFHDNGWSSRPRLPAFQRSPGPRKSIPHSHPRRASTCPGSLKRISSARTTLTHRFGLFAPIIRRSPEVVNSFSDFLIKEPRKKGENTEKTSKASRKSFNTALRYCRSPHSCTHSSAVCRFCSQTPNRK